MRSHNHVYLSTLHAMSPDFFYIDETCRDCGESKIEGYKAQELFELAQDGGCLLFYDAMFVFMSIKRRVIDRHIIEHFKEFRRNFKSANIPVELLGCFFFCSPRVILGQINKCIEFMRERGHIELARSKKPPFHRIASITNSGIERAREIVSRIPSDRFEAVSKIEKIDHLRI